jgi:hypothetical protein
VVPVASKYVCPEQLGGTSTGSGAVTGLAPAGVPLAELDPEQATMAALQTTAAAPKATIMPR